MQSYFICVLTITILILSACAKNEPAVEMPPATGPTPTIHDLTEIDLDEDGNYDFKIEYLQFIVEPLELSDGTEGVGGQIRPYGNNEILIDTNEGYLFLRDLNDIQESAEDPLKWRSIFSGTIVTITTINSDGDWPTVWEINSNSEHSTYFLGLKIVEESEIKLGWIEIDIDTSNGMVSIINKGIL